MRWFVSLLSQAWSLQVSSELSVADNERKGKLVITRAVTVTYEVPLSAYPADTDEQALEFERGLDKEAAVEQLISQLQFDNNARIIIGCDVLLVKE